MRQYSAGIAKLLNAPLGPADAYMILGAAGRRAALPERGPGSNPAGRAARAPASPARPAKLYIALNDDYNYSYRLLVMLSTYYY